MGSTQSAVPKSAAQLDEDQGQANYFLIGSLITFVVCVVAAILVARGAFKHQKYFSRLQRKESHGDAVDRYKKQIQMLELQKAERAEAKARAAEIRGYEEQIAEASGEAAQERANAAQKQRNAEITIATQKRMAAQEQRVAEAQAAEEARMREAAEMTVARDEALRQQAEAKAEELIPPPSWTDDRYWWQKRGGPSTPKYLAQQAAENARVMRKEEQRILKTLRLQQGPGYQKELDRAKKLMQSSTLPLTFQEPLLTDVKETPPAAESTDTST